MLVSRSLLGELETVLMRSKFRRYLSEDEASKYIERFRDRATMLPDPDSIPRATPDPKDDYLVAFALSSGADLLISGDEARRCARESSFAACFSRPHRRMHIARRAAVAIMLGGAARRRSALRKYCIP